MMINETRIHSVIKTGKFHEAAGYSLRARVTRAVLFSKKLKNEEDD